MHDQLDPTGFGQGWVIIWTLLLAPFSLIWYQLRRVRQRDTQTQARHDSTTSTTSNSSRCVTSRQPALHPLSSHSASTSIWARLLSPLHVALLALVSLLCTLCLMLLRAEPDTERTTEEHAIDTAYIDAPTIKGIDPGPRRRPPPRVFHGSAASFGGAPPPQAGARGSLQGARVALPFGQATGLVIPAAELQLGEVIGRGSFGAVVRATRHGVPVAVKLLTKIRPDDPEALARLTSEVEVMHRLRHPHVLQLLGVCEAPLALVTELCGAGSLESLLRKGHPSMASWKRRLLVATYAAQALEYLHLSQVLHNDIKAANVLLTSDLTVKLADYGAAVQLGGPGDVSDAAANHNPRWLAPELIKDASGSFPADVYAFGVLLFELLVWDVPFGKTTKDAEVARRVVLEGWRPVLPDPLPGGPCPPARALEVLMRRCWAQNPDDRPTAAEVAMELQGIVAGSGNAS